MLAVWSAFWRFTDDGCLAAVLHCTALHGMSPCGRYVHVWSPGKLVFTFGVLAETPAQKVAATGRSRAHSKPKSEVVVAEWSTLGMEDKFKMDWEVECDVLARCLRIRSFLPLRDTVLGQTVPEQTLLTIPFSFSPVAVRGWLVGWLAGWLAGWLVSWVVSWLVGRSLGWFVRFSFVFVRSFFRSVSQNT